MLVDSILDSLAFLKVQEALRNIGIGNVLVSFLAIATTALAIDYGRMLYLRSRMPPGPFPWPIVGNTYSLPENKPWIYFEALSKKFDAPIITFWIGR